MSCTNPNSSTPRRASLYTLGCRLNQAETAALKDRLQTEGYEIVRFGQPTDLLVLNSCSVTESAEADCRYAIRRTLRHSPHAFVAVTGCYAQTGADALRRIPGIDLVIGTQYKMHLPTYLTSRPALEKTPTPEVIHTKRIEREEFIQIGTGAYPTTRANLKIQDGCNFMCSFCLIPFARGHERSRRPDDTIREAETLADRGHRELVLTGVNLGQYASDGIDLLKLIQRLEKIHGIERIRISSIEPTTIPDALLEYMADSSKLCRHLHIPLQSGDDGILQAMNRRYTVAAYAAFLEKAARLIPDLCLGTDVMVGFPGEGDSAFSNTQRVAADLPFAYLHVFSFSPRPGTAATRLSHRVSAQTTSARSRTLAEVSRAKRLAFYQRFTDRTCRVLFEHHDRAGWWTGLTDNFIRVGVTSDQPLRNEMRDVVLTGVMDGLALGSLDVPRQPALRVLAS